MLSIANSGGTAAAKAQTQLMSARRDANQAERTARALEARADEARSPFAQAGARAERGGHEGRADPEQAGDPGARGHQRGQYHAGRGRGAGLWWLISQPK